jgi:hypothetical protein
MIPSLLVQVVTLAAVAVGFALGWLWRGWRDRQRAIEELRRRGIDPEDSTSAR